MAHGKSTSKTIARKAAKVLCDPNASKKRRVSPVLRPWRKAWESSEQETPVLARGRSHSGTLSRMLRSTLIGMALLVAGAVASPAQDLAELGEQSDISQILNASGTLYVLETHDLPDIVIYGSSRTVECEIVILRFLSGSTLSSNDRISVGLELTLKEDRFERTARLDINEAEALLASFGVMVDQGMEILESPAFDDDANDWRSEIHYATKEQVKIAAFINNANELQFGLKVGSRADWVILPRRGMDTFADNLARTIHAGRVVQADA